MRKIIFHYHLFKNAGTSLDSAFKKIFSEESGEWVTKEFSNNPSINEEGVKNWIRESANAKVFSSHTAIIKKLNLVGIDVFPVVFMRNPIDRIASAYSFEKKQNSDSFGSTLARNTNLKGYIETRLSIIHDRQCRDFHTHRLSSLIDDDSLSELERAKIAVEKLPFIGLVEDFDNSLFKLE